MLIYVKDGVTYVFIHIPKNAGKYIRNLLYVDKTNVIIKRYWGAENNLDLAHIPYMFKEKYVDNLYWNRCKINKSIQYYAHTRNPYDRIISTYFYKNPNKTICDFKLFVLNELVNMDFNISFDSSHVHYYPQYLFVCDKNFQLTNVKIKKIEDIVPNIKKYNLVEYYDDNIILIINGIYLIDFRLFGYQIIDSIKQVY